MSLTRFQKRIVWTCLIALWLSMFMPAISQTMKAMTATRTAQIVNDLCTSSGLVHLDTNKGDNYSLLVNETGDHQDHPNQDGHDGHDRHDGHDSHADHGDACGYCTLLAHSPLVTSYFHIMVVTAVTTSHAVPLLYDYYPPRPFRGQTNPLDPPSPLKQS
ncbi:DUF2946 domain-containing protein [Glaciimonas sp. Gout2]|uniref:DUF2946 domain-containing protein n=1 Tax=unclassified Glaciimonas TaxID=2644401 RepID=UPI002B23A110|nr:MULTISPECIES: DUF2946 domain-containing protein [unclassified Glaciimonas]MEB0011476.1 DUF2946 domain-containing protein [Glaciimonas sp. Cout2]MEB0081480.1 DUF2946 domain-containing protein [Glaciimonas sp. Gout2]